MALPILDGNQTAATLSTVVTGGQHIPAHTVVSLGSQAISDISNAVSSVQVSGVVTANSSAFYYDGANNVTYSYSLASWVDGEVFPASYADPLPAQLSYFSSGNILRVSTANPLPIQVVSQPSVTISNFPSTQTVAGTVTIGASSVTFNAYVGQRGDGTWSPISLQSGSNYVNTNVQNLPSGALTTRFGSVVTANLAFITSAVTNTSRKYLLAQNISAGTVTIGIGFSPTTTQGIQLTAGGGLTFDTFCPTGAVYWLGAVTGAAFTILEG